MRFARCSLFLLGAVAMSAALSAASQAQGPAAPAGGEKPKVDVHTLFLVHFNRGFAADYTRGNGKPLTRDNRGGARLVAGKFGRALSIPWNAFGIAYASEKNIDPRRGTVEFWVRRELPDLAADELAKTDLPFFAVGCDQTGLGIYRSRYNQVVAVVAEGYRAKSQLLFSNQGENSVSDGKWHHLAVTWDEEHMALFRDGRRKAATEKPVYPTVSTWLRDSITIGYAIDADYYYAGSSDKAAFVPRSAQAEIDELRISDVVRYVADFKPPEREF